MPATASPVSARRTYRFRSDSDRSRKAWAVRADLPSSSIGDIKPSNIFIHHGPAGPTPKLLDFGLAKVLQEDGVQRGQITQRGDLAGTLLYMSPEQLSGDATDARTDIYSLGVTLYELFTGQSPGEGAGDSLIAALRSQVVQPRQPPSRLNPQIPRALDALILRTLEHQASLRPNAPELLAALRDLAAALPDPR